jgi:diaminopimelate decarboxylase
MIARDLEEKKKLVLRLLAEPHDLASEPLDHVATEILRSRDALLALASRHETPFYAFDGERFSRALLEMKLAFGARIPRHFPFYAVKSNPHPRVLLAAVAHGFGLDVSSGRELRLALEIGECPVAFSGPAKTTEDLELAAMHADRVLVNVDSFRELERLGEVSARRHARVRAGVRISTDHHGAWSKFGIPVGDLSRFWQTAKAYPFVDLQGVHFHLSWNRDPRPYERIIEELGRALANLSPGDRAEVRFIDIGGGYRPHRLEGYFPSDDPLGSVLLTAAQQYGDAVSFEAPFYVKPSVPIDAYASAIGAAIDEHLRPLVDADTLTEPGRVVSTHAMHIVLRVVDKKSSDLVIVDGGINMVGWERYLATYCPVVNLTRPAATEILVRLGGSLCDCEDVWGGRLYGEGVEEGDVLVVPFQGAYSFATAQEFIRPIPPVYSM